MKQEQEVPLWARDEIRVGVVGQPTQRQDMLGHVTGTSAYYDDHRFANLLHLKILRSPHAHARIRQIDDSAAARAPGVKRIIRAADVPVNLNTLLSLIQFGKDDEPSLASDIVRYKGEPILGLVATSERAASSSARRPDEQHSAAKGFSIRMDRAM